MQYCEASPNYEGDMNTISEDTHSQDLYKFKVLHEVVLLCTC